MKKNILKVCKNVQNVLLLFIAVLFGFPWWLGNRYFMLDVMWVVRMINLFKIADCLPFSYFYLVDQPEANFNYLDNSENLP